MFTLKVKVTKSNNSISGSTQQRTSTLIQSSGTLKESCKVKNLTFLASQVKSIKIRVLSLIFFFFLLRLTVDGTPIREFKNSESIGVLFPKSKPMRMYASLWNADDWATRGGLVKTDWSKAPFMASYRNIKIEGCVHINGRSSCSPSSSWYTQQMDATSQARLRWVQKNYMIYNYCTDRKRFPQGIPRECAPSA